MFIENDSTVDIIIYYKKVGYHYLAYSEGEFKDEDLTDKEREEYKKLTVKMRELTWGLYNELQELSVDIDDEGNRKFNYKKYKEIRLIKLIADWDATVKDRNGADVKVNPIEKTIKSMSPEIAEALLNAYDQVMYLSEEEEKK